MNIRELFGVPGEGAAQAFAMRLVLALAYGLRQAAENDRKTILARGLREIWFLSVLVVQWWSRRMSPAEQMATDAALASLNLKPLAKSLDRVGERLEPLAKAAYEAKTDAALAGAGVYFLALLNEIGASTLVTAISTLLVGRTLDTLYERFPPQGWLELEFRNALSSPGAAQPSPPTGGAERFERAELGPRSRATGQSDDLVRAYFRSVGWSESDIERILRGPSGART